METKKLWGVHIHCNSEEEANECCLVANELGFRWNGGGSFKRDNYWWRYKADTCYNFTEGTISSIEYCKKNDLTVKSSKWFLDNFKNKDMNEEKKNVFVYIRGVEGRGQEVIDTLTELGGDNILGLRGTDPNRLYYIASSGTIGYTEKDCSRNSTWLKNHYTEIFLPKREFKDKQLVWCWDYGYNAQRNVLFYDAQYKCTFRHDGRRKGGTYDKYAPFEGEYPDWAKEAIKLLED